MARTGALDFARTLGHHRAMGEGADSIGAAATAGLIAREIERARIGAPALGHAADEPCANCGAHRHGPYCHACGQAGHVHRTLGALVHDVAHGVFHFEGKIWATLPLLALRPGELTRRYARGERARFVSPMALFLFSVFLMFAVVSSLGGDDMGPAPGMIDRAAINTNQARLNARHARLEAARAKATTAATRDALTREIASVDGELAKLTAVIKMREAERRGEIDAKERGAFVEDNLHTGIPGLDASLRRTARNPELTLYKMKSYAYKYSWALIPASLPLLWLLFAFRRDVGLYDHAIFATYSLAFMSLGVVALVVAGWIGTPSAIVVLAAVLIPPAHMYRQLKGAYLLGRLGALWRTGALLVITLVISILSMMALFYLGSE